MSVRVTVLESPSLNRAIRRAQDGADGLLGDILASIEGEARKGAKPHPVDTGETARSIESFANGPGRPLGGVVRSEHPAAAVLEHGRRPGARMPPTQPIADWVRRHGISAPVYVIARAIARRGIRPRRIFTNAVRVTENRLPELIRRAERRMSS